ncbi:glycosyltransferase [Fodinibius halophilus]|uniref:Glycosyltransferase n=1 Tax=Fodinibius halophilus TaxID=1736908 RepID=A0A6M1TI77_9BACT|nr:glycosyltransferase [Fodinibius halophilus]NGP88320.1 glycosyltransferase [Fodinibius halophilus]
MKKLLMIGPGQRHNIKPFLDYFQEEDTPFKLTYLSTGPFKYDRSNYNSIGIKELRRNPFSFISFLKLLRRDFDLIWYHGAYHWPLVLAINLVKSNDTKLNLNIWGERIPRVALKNTIMGRFYRWALEKADFVQCNWFGTEEIVKEAQPKANTNIQVWGLHNSYFKELPTEDNYQNETLEFVSHLPQTKTKFFFPKSLTPANRHDLLVSAASKLVSKGVSNFTIYFWLGREDPDLLRKLKTQIERKQVSDQVKIVKMPFLPFMDMKYIWTKMDCGLQIVDHDQLSSTVIEPLFMEKELVISNIRPYQILNNKFDLHLQLTDNNVNSIAKKLEEKITGNRTHEDVLKKRKEIVKTEFSFRDNIKKMVSFYYKAI